MHKGDDFYQECIEVFQEITKKPIHFLQVDAHFCEEIKDHLKKIYDFTKNKGIKTVESSPLLELAIQNFDLEQIWQQIELQNGSLMTPSLAVVSRLVVGKLGLLFKKEDNNITEDSDEYAEGDCDETSGEETSFEDVISNSIEETPNNEFLKNVRTSEVDDDFFKLHEMESFLENEEKKLNVPNVGNDSDESESEASVELFEENLSDSDDAMKIARYKDFFVRKEDTKRDQFCDDDENRLQSSFELRQSRVNKKIEEIEMGAVQEKSWQLKGEITADNRPQNSLLEEVVEFDLTTRPAPIITEQTTLQLEDVIKQRIRNRIFDSVERKVKPVETPLEYKKKLVLDQEKSKESLAQIYEKEFLQQQAALSQENMEKEEEEPELHQEINSLMRSLFVKLDALSNFHFTPKPALPELKIISNLPAINMEEVAPVATSDGALLAPEEIQVKAKGDIIGRNERSLTDKKRERRKKKLLQKIHTKEKQKKELDLGNRYGKEKAKKVMERVTKEKNVDKIDKSLEVERVKSSKAFFTQLQEQVKSQVKRKSLDKTSRRPTDIYSAKRVKL